MSSKTQSRGASKSKKKNGDDTQTMDSSVIEGDQTRLDEILTEIQSVKKDFTNIVKKDEIKDLITNTIKETMQLFEKKIHDEIKRQLTEKCTALEDRIKTLEFEKAELKDELEKRIKVIEDKTNEIPKQIAELDQRTNNSIRMANQNEQYSRKNNVKIMNIEESNTENEEELTQKICTILHDQGIELKKDEIMAIHRLPTKSTQIKPVIIKTVNNNVKAKIMRKRKELKSAGYRLADDVTKLNSGLINRLIQHDKIDSAWFFNGSVFGRTIGGKRLKFGLFDNINDVIVQNSKGV